MKIEQYVMDKWNQAIIRVKLFFVSDPEVRKELLVAYALNSNKGRKLMAEAMVIPLLRKMFDYKEEI